MRIPGVKWPRRDADHPPWSDAEVKEGVQLYLCCPSGPSWHILGWPLPLPWPVLFEWKFKPHPNPPPQHLDTALPSLQAASFVTSVCSGTWLHYGTGDWDITLLHKSDCRRTRVFIPTGWHHSRHSAGCADSHFTGTGLHSIPTVRKKEEKWKQVQRQRPYSSQVSTDTQHSI